MLAIYRYEAIGHIANLKQESRRNGKKATEEKYYTSRDNAIDIFNGGEKKRFGFEMRCASFCARI